MKTKKLILLILAIVLVVLAGAVALVLFTEPGRGMYRAFTLLPSTLSAPGAKAVGRVPGCKTGSIWETRDYWELQRSFRTAHPDVSALPPKIVACRVDALSSPPTCEAVADAYRSAVRNGGAFLVIVSQQLESAPVCQVAF